MNLILRLVLISLVAAGAVAFATWVFISIARKFIGHH